MLEHVQAYELGNKLKITGYSAHFVMLHVIAKINDGWVLPTEDQRGDFLQEPTPGEFQVFLHKGKGVLADELAVLKVEEVKDFVSRDKKMPRLKNIASLIGDDLSAAKEQGVNIKLPAALAKWLISSVTEFVEQREYLAKDPVSREDNDNAIIVDGF